ncbi:MAG: GNAT family N-acetyltransferase, partial [Candidatus Latescibacterota bacterium]
RCLNSRKFDGSVRETQPMRIEYLADYPHLAPIIARWHHEQWSYLNPAKPLASRIEEYQSRHKGGQIPSTVVALSGSEVVGSASLVEHDMDTHRELSPWLASVFVSPAHRGKGIGSALVRRIEREAGDLGISVLYLFTPDRESLYSRLHWTAIAREEYKGERVVIMKRKIDVENE